jgi:hypothetical protein
MATGVNPTAREPTSISRTRWRTSVSPPRGRRFFCSSGLTAAMPLVLFVLAATIMDLCNQVKLELGLILENRFILAMFDEKETIEKQMDRL